MTIHPVPKQGKKPKRPAKRIARTAIKKKKRSASEQRAKFSREYGGPAYLAFIKAHPCCACRVVGYTEAAHTVTGGTGRKADARTIVPLCGIRPYISGLGEGCHGALHRLGVTTFEQGYCAGKSLKEIAASLWSTYHRNKP